MLNLTSEIYTNADKAREHLEAIHWPHGPFCPHCGNARPERITKLAGKSTRPGVYKCNECREPFTVTVGTVFERSKIPLNKWVLASHLMAASKKGMSAHQLHRMLGVTYKTAWFMAHRIREAMKEDVKSSGPIGGEGKTVEADETYFGRREDGYVSPHRKGRPYLKRKKPMKIAIVGLVERGGKSRMFHVQHANKAEVRDVLVRNADRKSTLYTDESNLYPITGLEFAKHDTVKHSAKEYARGDVHTNTIENVFSVFKRGMVGVYQHCGEAHLHRYLAEFDFRYNRRAALNISDTERSEDLLRMARDKRLTYRRIGESDHA
ncbi:IS1595 family transposase [bacterium M00.F.Ca.ET.230.01.1.1]|nr:IS1595 family transposase [bacterium M00.F.Ca.ET.230.01.1.1]